MADVIALVGSETLLGREIREVFGESALGQDLRLVAAEGEEPGRLTGVGDVPAVVQKLDPIAVEDAAVVILAGPSTSSQALMDLGPAATVIDLTYFLEDEPAARVRAPLVEGADPVGSLAGPQIVAHPAAVAIAMVLGRLQESYPLKSSVIHIFEPASERGSDGIDELQQQTLNLMNFQELPKKVFGTQASFTMLAQYGEEAAVGLADAEERIERHLATLLSSAGAGIPMPSLRLVHAPVFHGYTFSLWLEFQDGATVEEIEDCLRDELIDVRTADVEAPDNVGVAGQSGIAVGGVRADRNNPDAFWVWMAADNLRLAAENAAMIAREIL